MLKKLLILVVVIVTVLYFFRGRVYLRDPLGTVYRDEVAQDGWEVYINQPKDILLVHGDSRLMVQHWDRVPAAPVKLTCLRWTACFADADQVPKVATEWNSGFSYDPRVIMTGNEVSYVEPSGTKMRIEIR